MTNKEKLEKICHMCKDREPGKLINDKYEVQILIKDLLKEFDRLEQIKYLEKELGIDFITLFKVLKEDKIYFKFFNEIQCWSPIKIDLRKRNIFFCRQVGGKYSSRQPLSNYGKTWALTKEELQHD